MSKRFDWFLRMGKYTYECVDCWNLFAFFLSGVFPYDTIFTQCLFIAVIKMVSLFLTFVRAN